MIDRPHIREVLETRTRRLLAIPGVVGTGEGVHKGKPCILVLVERQSPAVLRRIPRRIDGFAVVTKKVGRVSPRTP